MKVITKEFFGWNRTKPLRIVPLGDVHLGAAACDEKRFQKTINYIKDSGAYWIGMGDYCDFINRSDPRFNVSTIADWLVNKPALSDLSKAQATRFVEMVEPIADRCLTLLEGNHETAIAKYYERSIYSDIVTGIKNIAGIPGDEQLGMGYYGWILLRFYRSEDREAASTIKINLHHGFVGGKLAGAKALNMQRWLWTHDADLVLFGHSHNTGTQGESVESLDQAGNLVNQVRKGAYCGTFLKSVNEDGPATYSEVKGYFPLPMDGVEVILRPGAEHQPDRVKIMS